MLKYDFYRGWYLPSNGTIAEVVLHELDLNFQGDKFEALIYQKQWELLQKCIIWLLHRYSPLNGIIVNVLLCDLDLHFQGQAFSCYAFVVKICTGSRCSRQICLELHSLAVCCSCCLTWQIWMLLLMSVALQEPKRRGKFKVINSENNITTEVIVDRIITHRFVWLISLQFFCYQFINLTLLLLFCKVRNMEGVDGINWKVKNRLSVELYSTNLFNPFILS